MNDQDLQKRTYELAFLLAIPEDEPALQEIIAKVNAEVPHKSQLVPVRLAYPIKKHVSAYFGYYRLILQASEVPKLKELLTLGEKVVRFLLIAERGRSKEKAERAKPAPEQKIASRPEGLSNKALEEKLEEILK